MKNSNKIININSLTSYWYFYYFINTDL